VGIGSRGLAMLGVVWCGACAGAVSQDTDLPLETDLLSDSDPVVDTDVEIEAPVDDGYAHCETAERVGGFAVDLGDAYTTISGVVSDGVVPFQVREERLREGDCVFLYPRELYCEGGCESGYTCDVGGECVPYPSNVSLGQVWIEGLSASVAMPSIEPTKVYNFNGELPHPAFSAADPVELYAPGQGGLSMIAYGVEPLVTSMWSMDLVRGSASQLSWTPGASDTDVRVRVAVDIANHGGVPAQIRCDVPDIGSLQIPSALVDALLDVGYSGFPSVKMSRQSADVVTGEHGCIDLVVQSQLALPVEIPGLTSCSGDDDCPDGLSCLDDLSCG
jgi:hypothetical protein